MAAGGFPLEQLTLAHKVDEVRVIPLTPYLARLLMRLPRVGTYVFASTGKAGRITDARASHALALRSAGIDHFDIPRFASLLFVAGEAAGAPAGAIAQIMGTSPVPRQRAIGRAVSMRCGRSRSASKRTSWSWPTSNLKHLKRLPGCAS